MTANRSRRKSFAHPPLSGLTADLPREPQAPNEGPGAGARPTNAPIVLVPIGAVDEPVLAEIRPALETAFQRPVEMHKPLPLPKYAYNPTRAQYHAAAILKRVEEMLVAEWDSVVGFVNLDLFVPETPYIFGEADRSTRSAVVSFHRFRDEDGSAPPEVTLRRAVIESIHQVGLIRGLAQCPNNRCVMFGSTTLVELDKKGASFCANCRKRLATLTG